MSVVLLMAEGFESALLACSLILLVPGAAVGLTAREAAIPAMTAFAFGVLGLSWLRFSDRGGDYSNPAIAAALLGAMIVLLVPLVSRVDLTALPAGLVAGGAAAELWLPCVGEQFGTLLNQLPDRNLSGLGLMAVYVAGVLSPLAVLGALHHLTPDWILERLEPVWSVVGAIVLAFLAVATVFGYTDTLVGRLFEWST